MSIAEQRYRDIQGQASKTNRNTQELLILYVLEGFLSRVAESDRREMLILKGGVILAAFDARRPTRDVDFSGINIHIDAEYVLKLCSEIALIIQDDGIQFDVGSASAETIRDKDEYNGVRVSMVATLHTARIPFNIDLSVGDPIVPGAKEIRVPRMLDNSNRISLLGYPISMVLAEKIITAIQRGTVNTRWRDFGDIYQLSRRFPIYSVELRVSLDAVANYRAVEMLPLSEGLSGYAEIGQTKYENWRTKNNRLELPESFGQLLDAVYIFSDPILSESMTQDLTWDPLTFAWR